MTLEEYLDLIRDADTPLKAFRANQKARPPFGKKKKKRVGKKDPKMARALKKANAIGRTKSGKLRKGYTQARIMKKAHQLRRKM
tara:strand:+ start:1460 stop:1711 length:252 start_codon:yes stop_codon:yes gene_type:complete